MTEKDMELQKSRRTIEFLRKQLEEAERIHQLDRAEIVRLRRALEAMAGG